MGRKFKSYYSRNDDINISKMNYEDMHGFECHGKY